MIPMAKNRSRTRGVAVAMTAIWLTALMAVAAIGVEVARLATVATEVQVAADAAALGAAKNLWSTPGATQGTATSAGQAVAAQNQADGRFPASGNVNIQYGTWVANTGFVNGGGGGSPAVRATVTMPNVKYLMATVFGFATQTQVQKRATAIYTCQETGRPGPFTIGSCQLQTYTQGQSCSADNPTMLRTSPTPGQLMCWLDNSAGISAYLPPVAGCGTGTASVTAVGDALPAITNGNVTPNYRALQDCVGNTCVPPGGTGPGVHDYTIPIISCPLNSCNNGTTIGTVLGYATVHISCPGDIICPGCTDSPRSPGVDASVSPSVNFSQICNNDSGGGGGNNSGSTGCFGSGTVKLVGDIAGT
jgi:Flp pilus assembly protein TadG